MGNWVNRGLGNWGLAGGGMLIFGCEAVYGA